MPWWRSKEGMQKRSHFGPAASRRVNGALHRNIACKAAFERHRNGACSAPIIRFVGTLGADESSMCSNKISKRGIKLTKGD